MKRMNEGLNFWKSVILGCLSIPVEILPDVVVLILIIRIQDDIILVATPITSDILITSMAELLSYSGKVVILVDTLYISRGLWKIKG